jgi:crotonobetainyl-CoA:carnitine CoA-transferase CaiB-like acyl-CoA transferase
MGDAELAKDPNLAGRGGRVKHMDELHQRIRDWVQTLTLSEALERLEAGGVPASPVNTIAHIFADPQFSARENLIHVADPLLGDLVEPGVTPKLSLTPGGVRSGAPMLGQHNREVYCDLLNVDSVEYEERGREGVI